MFGWFDIQIDLEDLIHSQSFEMNRQQIFKDERGRGQVLTLDGWEFFWWCIQWVHSLHTSLLWLFPRVLVSSPVFWTWWKIPTNWQIFIWNQCHEIPMKATTPTLFFLNEKGQTAKSLHTTNILLCFFMDENGNTSQKLFCFYFKSVIFMSIFEWHCVK